MTAIGAAGSSDSRLDQRGDGEDAQRASGPTTSGHGDAGRPAGRRRSPCRRRPSPSAGARSARAPPPRARAAPRAGGRLGRRRATRPRSERSAATTVADVNPGVETGPTPTPTTRTRLMFLASEHPFRRPRRTSCSTTIEVADPAHPLGLGHSPGHARHRPAARPGPLPDRGREVRPRPPADRLLGRARGPCPRPAAQLGRARHRLPDLREVVVARARRHGRGRRTW